MQVRKSVDEGDGGNEAREGRFIETTATNMDSPEEASEGVHSVPQHDKEADVASSSAGSQSDAEKQSVWQRLKEIGGQNKRVSAPHPLLPLVSHQVLLVACSLKSSLCQNSTETVHPCPSGATFLLTDECLAYPRDSKSF